MARSIGRYNGKLYVLIVDALPCPDQNTPSNIEFLSVQDIKSEKVERIIKKYGRNKDKLRWALKPMLLLHLLDEQQKVVYVDNDIYFFDDFSFIFNELQEHPILLTPHFYPSSPLKEQTWLEANFRVGLYNAGFIAVNDHAKEALDWWADCCLYEIRKAYYRGLFDDQKYLDLFPVLFDGVKILKHRGCNLAAWNDQAKIEKEKVVFIHFSPFTINKFKADDNYYHSFFEYYLTQLKIEDKNFKPSVKKVNQFYIQNGIYYLRWKLARLFN